MTRLITSRPQPADPRSFAFPSVIAADHRGVDLRAVHLPGRARARLLVVADAGAAAEPFEQLGVAAVTSEVLLRGAAGLGAHELAIAFEQVGAQPDAGVGYDTAQVSLDAPTGVLGEAARLLAEVVRRPTLADRDVAETRDSFIDEKHAAMTRAESVVARIARRAVWSPTSRYATSASGNEHTLPTVSTANVRDFHAARWATGRLAVIVVGDLRDVDLDGIGASFVGDGDAVASTVDTGTGTGGTIVLAERPQAAQSALLFASPGRGVGEPDEADLEVALSAAVGSFSGRLNQRLREELGYTYGARGGITRRRHGGTFAASLSVRTEVTADAVRECLEVIDGAVDQGLSDDEVAQARDNLVRRYPVTFDANATIAAAVAERWTHHLPDDHHDRRLEQLQAVTTASANAALRRNLRLDDLTVAVAGDAVLVEAPLVALGRGPVVRARI